jgi:hypothetical protein
MTVFGRLYMPSVGAAPTGATARPSRDLTA